MSFQVDALEQDVSEILSIVQSLKNSLAPINRIPPEILSLIPDYFPDYGQASIALTHVCRSWREIFISCSSLWTYLDLKNIDKTRTFIQRSKSSPLSVYASSLYDDTYLEDALSLVIPHIPRLESFIFYSDSIPTTLSDFHYHAPLLENLKIHISSPHAQPLDIPLLNGDPLSLRTLTLAGDIIRLPQKRMSSLREFSLFCTPGAVTITQILDFLESSPLLHTIDFTNSIPGSSDAPSERIVHLPHLETLTISSDVVHYIFNYLHIPVGASLIVCTALRGSTFPLLEHLSGTSPNIENLSHITAVNLRFGSDGKYGTLSGPSGTFSLRGWWKSLTTPPTIMDDRILRSLGPRILSTTERLTISDCMHQHPADVEEWPIFRTLLSTNNLQTLVLSWCNSQPFISALNPGKNLSGVMLCPNLKELILFVESWGLTDDLVGMAKRRALRGAKLSSIKIVSLDTPVPEMEALELREHVTQVECMVDNIPPCWEYLPDETGGRWG